MKRKKERLYFTRNLSAAAMTALLTGGMLSLPAEAFAQNASTGYYEIANADDLYAFAKLVNEEETDFSGQTVVLTKDILLPEETEWIPVGEAYGSAFSGTFDGQNHTITGLYIRDTEYDGMGLFGHCSDAVIQNVHLKDVDIAATDLHTGGICGHFSGGTISGCTVSGMISGNTRQMGGIVGYLFGTITGCSNAASIIGDGSQYAGIAGMAFKSKITECSNSGNIDNNSSGTVIDPSASTSIGASKFGAGGICGYIDSGTVISNCSNTGAINGLTMTGGIAGHMNYNGTSISNCYNTGTVNGNGASNSGAICGSSYDEENTVSNCYYNSDTYSGTAIGSGTYTSAETVAAKTSEEFASGAVAYLLNTNDTSETDIWGQNIGTENAPVLGGTAVLAVTNENGETAYTNPENSTVLGDINEDGTVDINDASIILNLYAYQAAGISTDEYSEAQKEAAHINADDVIDIADASAVLSYYARNAAGLNPTWDSVISG